MPFDHTISVSSLTRLIGAPDAPALIDFCIDDDFALDPRVIPGAFRWPFVELDALAGRIAGRSVVAICQKGLKISQGAAALLRTERVDARALSGGIVAWREAGLPLIPWSTLPPRDETGRTRWVGGGVGDIDDCACAWLIRRFVDREARFLFVEAAQVDAVAERFGAAPLSAVADDVAAADGSSGFRSLLAALSMDSPALNEIASIAARSRAGQGSATGLSALFTGLSALNRDPVARVEAAMSVFDGLYREAVDRRSDRKAPAEEATA